MKEWRRVVYLLEGVGCHRVRHAPLHLRRPTATCSSGVPASTSRWVTSACASSWPVALAPRIMWFANLRRILVRFAGLLLNSPPCMDMNLPKYMKSSTSPDKAAHSRRTQPTAQEESVAMGGRGLASDFFVAGSLNFSSSFIGLQF